MAEETDAGETDSTTKVASVCGLWSAGVTALLSGYPLVFSCGHQFLFHCLEVLIQGTSPPRAVSCKALPGCCIGVDHLHVSQADVLVSQPWAASGSRLSCQLSVENVF